MRLYPGCRDKEKGFAMLIHRGTIVVILSDREGCSNRVGEEKKESREEI